jgi:hypothetical protein
MLRDIHTEGRLRRILRLARNRDLQRAAANTMMAVALVFPILVVALDQHGVERLPNHAHAVPLGAAAPPHIHSFEIAHSSSATNHAARGAKAPAILPRQPPVALLTLPFGQDAGFQLPVPPAEPNGRPDAATPADGSTPTEAVLAPPDHPPRSQLG